MLSHFHGRWLSTAFFAIMAASNVVAAPSYNAQSLQSRQDDAARQADIGQFTVPLETLDAAVTCPNSITGRAGGIVLLVHGTGSTSDQSWSGISPWLKMLPDLSPGYDVCYVDLPNYSYTDLQVNGEYVARAIMTQAPKSATGKVSIVGHSQGGGANPQWGLTFWPTTRSLVHAYVSLAGDFHGAELNLGVANPFVPAAYFQQLGSSRYIAAQNAAGGTALVPTTSIWSNLFDELLFGVTNTSALPGATNIVLQDSAICGPNFFADHFTTLSAPASMWLTLSALQSPNGVADPTTFDPAHCNVYPDAAATPSFDTTTTILFYLQAFQAQNMTPFNVQGEPKLAPYVCLRDPTITDCGTGFY